MNLIPWIIGLPLFGAIAIGLSTRFTWSEANEQGEAFGEDQWDHHRFLVRLIGVGSVAGSFLIALYNFVQFYAIAPEGGRYVVDLFEWFSITIPSGGGWVDVPIHARLVFDSLSGVMTLVVTGIGTLIHLYSTGYMSTRGENGAMTYEPSYGRFFCYLNLFTASMLILVLSSSLPLMFVGWEGVGLCSYLLIGFWHKTPEYAEAGKKAFIANRIGDLGVLIGMFTLVMTTRSFEFAEINSQTLSLKYEVVRLGGFEVATAATFACMFLFLGCAGKSAQIPLFVWLPDAMAGPTPVSALIHAATMVTSGVYLCCRLSPVFLESPTTLTVIALVGTATALLGATVAIVQREMKKILAYSTVSQLGFMFAAVGVAAFSAAFFHVFTHAFFKACLFLGAGAVMHAVHAHGDADIYRLGGLKKYLPVTRWTFFIATAAIAGLPLTSGFFSKDELLLGAANIAFNDTPIPQWAGWTVLIGLFLAATMTAFYMFRLYFLTFTGDYRSGADYLAAHAHEGDDAHAEEGGDHGHGDDHGHDDHHDHYPAEPEPEFKSMSIPLIVLAAGALIVGFLGLPHALHLPNWWGHWMAPSIASMSGFGPSDHIPNMSAVWLAMALGIGAWAIGNGSAFVAFRNKNEDKLTVKIPQKLRQLLLDKWRVDELYERIFIGPVRALAQFSAHIDGAFVDGLLAKLPTTAVRLGSFVFTRAQNGLVQLYGVVLLVGVLALGWWFIYPHASVEVEATPVSATIEIERGFGYEYRFDMNGDGNFEYPEQPEIVEIDLRDNLSEAEFAGVVRAVGTATGDSEEHDRRVLGRLLNGAQKRYELHVPHGRNGALRSALNGLGDQLQSQRWRNAGTAEFSPANRAASTYDEADYRGSALVAIGEEDVIELSSTPRVLPTHAVFDRPPRARLNDEGLVEIIPNDAQVIFEGHPQQEPFTLSTGDNFLINMQVFVLSPVVHATVEVRNAFGNIDRHNLEIVLKRDLNRRPRTTTARRDIPAAEGLAEGEVAP